jgi:hypothetical protein
MGDRENLPLDEKRSCNILFAHLLVSGNKFYSANSGIVLAFLSFSKDRGFSKTRNLILESATEPYFPKLKIWF